MNIEVTNRLTFVLKVYMVVSTVNAAITKGIVTSIKIRVESIKLFTYLSKQCINIQIYFFWIIFLVSYLI